jgi:CheY-like chemotaxis protein
LVELLGGQIGVASQPGKGSTFWFNAAFETPPCDGEEPVKHTRLEGVRVLIVDDHAATLEQISGLLRLHGCRPQEAANGELALAALRAARREGDPFRVVLLDSSLPAMTGEQLAARIQVDPEFPGTALICLTPVARHAGASGVVRLTKPVRQAQLYACIAQVLRRPVLDHARGPVPKAGNRGRILIVADETPHRREAQAVLAELGYLADTVAGGNEALEWLRNMPCDLVLMDCRMPEIDGWAAAARRRYPRIPIVALQADATRGDCEEYLAGMDRCLPAPFVPAALAAVVEKWLSGEGQSAALAARVAASGANAQKERNSL